MGDGFRFLDIILFAAVAAFFVLRLRSVLGRRTGREKPPPGYDRFGRREDGEAGEEKVIPLPDRTGAGREGAQPNGEEPAAETEQDRVGAGLARIKVADKSFDEETFLAGARAAFEMVVSAYARGDAKGLRPLLSNDVYADFSGAIEDRRKARQTLETTLVGIDGAEIIDAELQGRSAFVKIRFASEQVNVLRDAEGNVVEGDPAAVTKITDVWTFARNTRSRDPNWTLVATESPD